MKKYMLHILMFLTLTLTVPFLMRTEAQALERTIVIYNGETSDGPEEEEWEDDDFYMDEDDLLLPGDTGKVTAEEDSYLYKNIVRTTYQSSDSSIFDIKEDGSYTVLKSGYIDITVIGWNEENEIIYEGTKSIVTGGDVSATTLDKTSFQGYIPDQLYSDSAMNEVTVSLVDAPELRYCSFVVDDDVNSAVSYHLDRKKRCITLSATCEGTFTFKFRLNRKEFLIKIKINRVYMKKDSLLLTQKGKYSLSLKGYKGKLKWYSTNKKVATVTQKGNVSAKKKSGCSIIYVQMGDCRIGCAVNVVTAKMKNVINTAKKIGRTCKYSQPKRMRAGFYDCSSLVWKSYRKIGKTFGDKHYAPVAASIAKWCAVRKRMIKGGMSYKNLQAMKFKPGDLLFPSGSNNKRYKGIYHVEMFVGYRCLGFHGKNPVVISCWANRMDGYGMGGKVVGRP